jgi:selenide,water dikinase
VAPSLDIAPSVTDDLVTIAHDPQTSGGLLAAVAPDRVEALEAALDAAGVERWWIGRVEAGEPGVSLR